MNSDLLMLTFRIWLVEIPVAGINWFLLAERVYRPRVGELHAHQIAMTTRIVWILGLACALVRLAGSHTALDTLEAGAFWMLLWLAFEWGGSTLLRRPVRETLVGWHVTRGYMWPYVLAVYLLAPSGAGFLVASS